MFLSMTSYILCSMTHQSMTLYTYFMFVCEQLSIIHNPPYDSRHKIGVIFLRPIIKSILLENPIRYTTNALFTILTLYVERNYNTYLVKPSWGDLLFSIRDNFSWVHGILPSMRHCNRFVSYGISSGVEVKYDGCVNRAEVDITNAIAC